MAHAIATLREVRIDPEGRRFARSFNGLHEIAIDDHGRETWEGDAVLARTDGRLGWVHETELDKEN